MHFFLDFLPYYKNKVSFTFADGRPHNPERYVLSRYIPYIEVKLYSVSVAAALSLELALCQVSICVFSDYRPLSPLL